MGLSASVELRSSEERAACSLRSRLCNVPPKPDIWQSVINPLPRLKPESSLVIAIVVVCVLVALGELAGWRTVKHSLSLIPAFLNMALQGTGVQRLQQFERAQ